mgnify:CR=1 FL=1
MKEQRQKTLTALQKIKFLYSAQTYRVVHSVKDDIYFEIKGWWRDDAYIKYNSFKIQYSNIEIIIIDKSELLKLGILKK